MNNSSKIAIGLSLVGGALLAAWLLTGDRKRKTKDFVVKKAQVIKEAMRKGQEIFDDSDIHYV